jgi:hypothetical protein
LEARFDPKKLDSCPFRSTLQRALHARFKGKCTRFRGDPHLQAKVHFFIIFGVRVGPSLGLGLRGKEEENKGALSPPFSSLFHFELGGESKGELESADF